MTPRTSRRLRRYTLNATGVVVFAFAVFPVFWMVSTAFKPTGEVFATTPHPLPVHPTLRNFATVMNGKLTAGVSFWIFFRNSLLVAVVTVLLSSLFSLLAATAVARFRFRFRTSLLIMLLIVQMLPQEALVIPLFVNLRRLGLTNNLIGLIVVYTGLALPFSVLMLRGFIAAVPRELEEAAAIDGATQTRIFWRILFPLVAPGLIATSIFSFITAWNEFIYAYTYLQDEGKYTLPIFVQFFFGRFGSDWGSIMAASTLFTLPVMVFFLMVQRRMVSGLVAGAVKG